jgi:HK97 family phage major capsid protein
MADAVSAEAFSIEDREARVADIDNRVQEIDTDYAGTSMPSAVRDEWNELNRERDEQVKVIAELRARKERLAQIADSQPQATERVGGGNGNGGGGAPAVIRRRGAEIYDLHRIRSESHTDEEYRTRLHDNAKRAIEQARYGVVRGVVTREDAQTNVLRLLDGIDDERGTLAKRILATGSPEYERWFWAQVSGKGDVPRPQAALTLSGTGVAVPFELDPTVIITSDGATNPLRAMSRVETIVGKTWSGVTSAGITVGRLGEALASTDNAPTLAGPTLTPTSVRGFVPFSIESDQDWTQLRSEMTRLLQDAKDVEEATAFVTGSGTPPAPSGIQATLTTASNVNDGVTFTINSIAAADNALPPRFVPRAQWLARKNTYNTIRTLDSNGTLYVRLTDGRPPELLGYPAREASAMPVRFTSSTVFGGRYAILGDWSNFLIVDKAGMDIEIIPHLFGAAQGNLPTGQRAIFALWRNNSLILNGNAFRVLVYAT